MSRRVVVTGGGCVTPLGTELAEVWKNLTEGRSGIRPITLFDASDFPIRIAAEVPDFDISEVGEDPAFWQNHPRQTQFAMAAAIKAVQSAALDTARLDPVRFGVYLGCGETFPDIKQLGELMAASVNGLPHCRRTFLQESLAEKSFWYRPDVEPNMPSSFIAGMFDAQGPNLNCIAACASSTQSIGAAAEIIRRGDADVMLAGGAHSMIDPAGISGLHRLSVLSNSNERVEKAMRPFDLNRDGFVAGEGGAVVVLESLEHAQARRADIWGELVGYASAHDAFRATDTHPDGRAFVHCVREALRQAQLAPEQLDYINAHGTSTRLNDRVETFALKQSLGEAAYSVPVSSTKSMMGHSTTACGAVELVIALMAIRTGVIPPTINYETADPECDLDYVPNTAREINCRHVLSNSLGFGGQSAALLVSRFDGRRRPR
ncbi:MAG TPA: beta-ketoacyl-[acyl-carrier-protein] synthase family protein [Thermoguttaceae bacterium]|nr:beta-ketoacyl-[acyl-carrier-protein] synthase family protein [Thermoguttaceae bacterium]